MNPASFYEYKNDQKCGLITAASMKKKLGEKKERPGVLEIHTGGIRKPRREFVIIAVIKSEGKI